MERVKVNIAALSKRENSKEYIIILEEENGGQKLPIVIGPWEAQAIAIHLEGVPIKRPLTHDLLISIVVESNHRIEEAVICQYKNEVFHANLKLVRESGEVVHIDCRSSDAIAAAIRCTAPIYVTYAVMKKAGMTLDSAGRLDVKDEIKLTEYSLADLRELLRKAVQEENYKLAADLRNEIEVRVG